MSLAAGGRPAAAANGNFVVVVASTPGEAGGELVWTTWELGGGGDPFKRVPIDVFHASDVAPAVSFRNTLDGSLIWLGVVDVGDGSIWETLQQPDGTFDSSWTNIPGLNTQQALAVNTQPSVSTMLALAAPNDDRLRYNVYLNDQPPTNPPPDYWRDLTPPIITSMAPAIAMVDGGDYIFVAVNALDLAGPDGTIQLNQGNPYTEAFVGYESMGFSSNLSPAMASVGNRTVLVAVDPDGTISYNWWDLGGGPQGWTPLPGLTTDITPAVALVDGGNYVFVIARGPDNDLHLSQAVVGDPNGIVPWGAMQ